MIDRPHIQAPPATDTHLRTLIRLRWVRLAAQPAESADRTDAGCSAPASSLYRRAA